MRCRLDFWRDLRETGCDWRVSEPTSYTNLALLFVRLAAVKVKESARKSKASSCSSIGNGASDAVNEAGRVG